MKISQLIKKLKWGLPVNWELPIQVYDFTDTFQILGVNLHYDRSFPSKLVLIAGKGSGGGLTVKKLIDEVEKLRQAYNMVVLLPDDTQHTLDDVEFDQKNQVYAITLGDKINVLKNIEGRVVKLFDVQ